MDRPLVTALAGVTISCENPSRLAAILLGPMGWQLFCEGNIDADHAYLWGVDPASAGERFAIYRSPRATRGMIRVVRGNDRERTRPLGTRWSGVEIVVTEDLNGLCSTLEAHADYRMIKKPLEADFTDAGANIHRTFYGRAPGGTHLMFTQAVTAARDYDFPTAESRVGHIFDMPLVSADFDRSLRFYRDQLRMLPLFEERLTEGVWQDAWDLPSGAVVEVAILKGDAPDFGLGGIELQGYGESFIDPIPVEPNRFDGGTCLTSYTTRDIKAAFRAIADSPDATLLSQPRPYLAPPYNGAQSFCFLGPGGERFEICEALWRG